MSINNNHKAKTKKVGGLHISLRNTSKFTDEEVWDALKHIVRGIKWKYSEYVNVNVKNSQCCFAGRIYDYRCRIYHESPFNPLIVARISSHEKEFPEWVKYEKKKEGYLPHWILSRKEALIHVLSHEFRHLWQGDQDVLDKKRRGSVWGSRGVYSNRDADAFAIRKVREYRKLHNGHYYYSAEVNENF